MIAIIGGPGEKKGGDKPSFGVGIKLKPKKINGIGGDYDKDNEEGEEGDVMSDDEKKLEAARPLARKLNVSPELIVETFAALFNLHETEPHAENTEGREASEEEGD